VVNASWSSTAPVISPQRSPVANAIAASSPMNSDTVVIWLGVKPRRADQRAMYFEYGLTKKVVKKPSLPLTADSSSTRSSSYSVIASAASAAMSRDSGRAQNSRRR
jgi:hypothetical protein